MSAKIAKAIGRRAASFYGAGRYDPSARLAKHSAKYTGVRKALARKLRKLRKASGPTVVRKSSAARWAKRLQNREVQVRRTAKELQRMHSTHRAMVQNPGKAIYLKGKRYARRLPSV